MYLCTIVERPTKAYLTTNNEHKLEHQMCTSDIFLDTSITACIINYSDILTNVDFED